MNDYEKQQDHYNKAMKNFIDASKEFQELTPEKQRKICTASAWNVWDDGNI